MLFGEPFYYWYYLSFEQNLVTVNWDAADQMKKLSKWLVKHDSDPKHQADIEKFRKRYQEWIKEKSTT